jgi:hypothetical protein
MTKKPIKMTICQKTPIFRPEILKLVIHGQNLTDFLTFFLNTPN